MRCCVEESAEDNVDQCDESEAGIGCSDGYRGDNKDNAPPETGCAATPGRE